MGAVAALGAVRAAVTAARLVLRHTTHTLLAGAAADDFAVAMGLPRSKLTTPRSAAAAAAWCRSRRSAWLGRGFWGGGGGWSCSSVLRSRRFQLHLIAVIIRVTTC